MSQVAFEELSEPERSFAARAIRRKPLFRRVSNASIAVALVMALAHAAILEKLMGRG